MSCIHINCRFTYILIIQPYIIIVYTYIVFMWLIRDDNSDHWLHIYHHLHTSSIWHIYIYNKLYTIYIYRYILHYILHIVYIYIYIYHSYVKKKQTNRGSPHNFTSEQFCPSPSPGHRWRRPWRRCRISLRNLQGHLKERGVGHACGLYSIHIYDYIW